MRFELAVLLGALMKHVLLRPRLRRSRLIQWMNRWPSSFHHLMCLSRHELRSSETKKIFLTLQTTWIAFVVPIEWLANRRGVLLWWAPFGKEMREEEERGEGEDFPAKTGITFPA